MPAAFTGLIEKDREEAPVGASPSRTAAAAPCSCACEDIVAVQAATELAHLSNRPHAATANAFGPHPSSTSDTEPALLDGVHRHHLPRYRAEHLRTTDRQGCSTGVDAPGCGSPATAVDKGLRTIQSTKARGSRPWRVGHGSPAAQPLAQQHDHFDAHAGRSRTSSDGSARLAGTPGHACQAQRWRQCPCWRCAGWNNSPWLALLKRAGCAATSAHSRRARWQQDPHWPTQGRRTWPGAGCRRAAHAA